MGRVELKFVAAFLLSMTGSEVGGVPEMFIQGGAFALVAWAFVQLVRNTIPSIARSSQETAKAQQESFILELRTIRLEASKEAQTQRESFSAELRNQQNFLGELQTQRHDFQTELSKQRHALLNVISVLQTSNRILIERLKLAGARVDDLEPVIERNGRETAASNLVNVKE